MTRSIATALPIALVADIRWGAIGSLVLAAAAVMGSPGPATISVAAVASAYGVRRSLPYVAGAIAGTMLVLVAVATGVTATVLAVPALQTVVLAVAVGYILWLAYHIATAPPLAQTETSGAPSLAGAAVLAIANPKAWLAIAAVFAGTQLVDDAAADAVAKSAVLAGMIVLIMVVWLLAGALLASTLRDPRRARAVNVSLAAALVATTLLAVLR